MAMSSNRYKIDPNLKFEQMAPAVGQNEEDEESSYLYHVTVEQFDENEEEILETLKAEIKILIEDERIEARKMLATFGADDEEEEIDEANSTKVDTPKPPKKTAEPKVSTKKTPKAKGKAAKDDRTQNGTLIDLTPKNLKADAVLLTLFNSDSEPIAVSV